MCVSRIHPITVASCGPTAVAAITNSSAAAVEAVFRDAAKSCSEPPPDFSIGVKPRVVAEALNLLGFDLFIEMPGHPSHGKKIHSRNVHQPLLNSASDWERYPSIEQFLSNNSSLDVLLCISFRHPEDSDLQSHTFVVDGKWFFDCNTDNKIVGATAIPANVRSFRVSNVYSVRSSTSS